MGGCENRCKGLTICSIYFYANCTTQWETYTYADQAQEHKRLDALENRADTSRKMQQHKADRADQKKANFAWSDKLSRQQDRDIQKEKKKRKKIWLKSQEEKETEDSTSQKRARDEEGDKGEAGDDWAEMTKEDRMAKKRKGDVSHIDFDMEFNP